MDLHTVYFWTDTIKDWKHLLKKDKYKQLILDNLDRMAEQKLIIIYAFVIMPNHLHLIWCLDKLNGKEKPQASFNKETAHRIVKDLKLLHPQVLSHFKEISSERNYRIWQRDPMAILMDSQSKVEQNLDSIHCNPISSKWNLANTPEDYSGLRPRFMKKKIVHSNSLPITGNTFSFKQADVKETR